MPPEWLLKFSDNVTDFLGAWINVLVPILGPPLIVLALVAGLLSIPRKPKGK